MSEKTEVAPDKEYRIRARHVVALFTGIVLVHAVSGAIVYFLIDDWPKRGQFGDLFGAVNALFSGLAFAGVIVTILLQREELHETRKELRRSASAQEASERALRAQADAAEASARLNATSTLLSHLLEERRKIESSSAAMAMYRTRYQEIREKIDRLLSEVDRATNLDT